MRASRFFILALAAVFGGCGLLPDIKVTVAIPLSTAGNATCTTQTVTKKLTDYPAFNENKDKIDVSSADLIGARVVIKSVDAALNTATSADGRATITAGSESFDATVTNVAIAVGTKADITLDRAAAKRVATAAMKSPYEVSGIVSGTPRGSTANPVCNFGVDLELDFIVKPKVL